MAAQMPVTSAGDLFAALREFELLSSAQLEQLTKAPDLQGADPQALLRRLVKDGWLTRFQAEQVYRGRGEGLVLGQYCLLEPVGEGGMGQVFKARHRLMNRLVALKVIREKFLHHPEAVARFRREIRAAARLSHPNIVTAHDAAEDGQQQYLVMEYVEGPSLAQMVRTSGALPVEQTCRLMYQAALGLQHAHERGMIHRDIKPGNLLVGPGGVLKILDLGLARLLVSGAETRVSQHANVLLGTPDYMPPEQSRDLSAVDIRSDLYALGCTFYFIVCGQVPFPGGQFMEKILRHRTEDPVPPERLRPDVPKAVADIIRKLLAKEAADRYQTPLELATALLPLLNPESGDTACGTAGMSAPTMRSTAPAASTEETARSAASPLGAADATPASLPEAAPPLPGGSPGLPQPEIAGAEPGPARQAPAEKHRTKRGQNVQAAAAAPQPNVLPRRESSPRRWRMWAAMTGTVVLILVVLAARSLRQGPGSAESRPSVIDSAASQPRALHWELSTSFSGNAAIARVALSPNARIVAALYEENKGATVWIVTTRALLFSTARTRWVAFSPDNKSLTTSVPGAAGKISLHDASTGAPPQQTLASVGQPAFCEFLDEKNLIVVRKTFNPAQPAKVVKFSLEDGTSQEILPPLRTSSPGTFALSPDRRFFAGIAPGGVLRVWDLISDKHFPQYVGQPLELTFVAFSHDGRTFMAVGAPTGKGFTREVRHWDLETGKPRSPPIWLDDTTTCLALSPDGKGLITGNKDGTVRLLDLVTGEECARRAAHQGPVSAVLFSADGKTLATAGSDAALKLWDWEP